MRVKIGNFLRRIKESVQILDDVEYKRVTIKMNNGGVYLRNFAKGSAIGTKKQFKISAGQFILSKIDARNGAFGVVPDSLDDSIITGNFWTYEIDKSKIDIDWFILFVSTKRFINICKKASSGTTNRMYLQEDKFLNIEIDLPSVSTQKQVSIEVSSALDKYFRFQKLIERNIAVSKEIKSKVFDFIVKTMSAENMYLFDLASVKGGKRIPKGDNFAQTTTSHIYLRVADMKKGSIIASNLKYIDEDTFEKIKNYTISSNDLYVSIAGTIGVIGEIPEILSGANLTENAAKITPTKVSKKFLYYALNSSSSQKQMFSFVNRMAQPKLALKRLGSIRVPYLSSADEEKLVDNLDKNFIIIEKIDFITDKNSKMLANIKNKICLDRINQ